MAAYYNEIDKPTAQWLKELIRAGLIADGEVDDRDMWDVVPAELMGFDQWHFCAGIGGWSAALRLAGWPDDRQVLTISLPCQPFSAAGKGGGLDDQRGQLAEAFFWINSILRPYTIFGEQVEAALRHDWLDVMAVSLEGIGYAVGAVGFPACSVGAPHIRQRLYWVANLQRRGCTTTKPSTGRSWDGIRKTITENDEENELERSPACGVADAASIRYEKSGKWICEHEKSRLSSSTGIVGDAGEQGLQRHKSEFSQRSNRDLPTESGKTHFWSDAEWTPCRDGKARPVESGAFPLVDGLSERMVHRSNQGAPNAQIDPQNTAEARVMRLRGYGNAIVVTQAAAFIESFLSR